jgi:S-DNA-T family DNA segregation ATPase FtsK/SpoIIIE
MVKPEAKREIQGVLLLAGALFLTLALLPLPSGNLIGRVGRGVQSVLWGGFGLGAALLPFGIAVAGVHAMGWMDRARMIRWLVLSAGLLLLIPPALSIPDESLVAWGGWWGRLLGEPLVGAFGVLGAVLFLSVSFVILSLVTVGWNPLRPILRIGWSGLRVGGSFLGTTGGWTWRALSAWRAQRLEARQHRDEARRLQQAERELEAEAQAIEEWEDEGGAGDENGGPWEEPGEPPVSQPSPASGADPAPRRASPKASVGDQLALLPDPRSADELKGVDLPAFDLLTAASRVSRRDMDRELDELGSVLVEKLRTFNVESEIGGRTTGPVVTQFEVIPAPGVKVNRIANLDADLALAMRAKTIRIVAPIPGKGAVGVEIPNPTPEVVQLREILESDAFAQTRADLPLALGKDLHGSAYVADLAKMPHALIAGATGSGKSVCLNTVITSLVYRHTPETLRLLLIDPKMVELSTYSDLPHLRHPVVTNPKEAAGVLKWAVLEMERRYTLLKENGVRSLGEFNRRLRNGGVIRRVEPKGPEGDPDRWVYQEGVLPFIVLVVDELADLMMTVQSEVEKPLTLLAQKARAIGIHLIVATQRPSVNVITGLIKANFPCRIAFRVASKTDSRTILDQNGADALLGNGDMLFLPPGQSAPLRVQGAYISTEDTDRMMDWFRELRKQRLAELETAGVVFLPGDEDDILEVVRALEAEAGGGGDEEDGFDGDWDPSFREAAEVCIASGQGSTSLLQRKLRIGYGRAARIVDQLHDAGVLGAPDGSKPREVLMSMEQLARMMNGGE